VALKKSSHHRALWSKLHIWLGVILLLTGIYLISYSWVVAGIVILTSLIIIIWKGRDVQQFNKKNDERTVEFKEIKEKSKRAKKSKKKKSKKR
jgi:membrane protein implicated in regulation of membrane protease activity